MFSLKVSYPNRLEKYDLEMLLINTTEGIIGIKSNHENIIIQLDVGSAKLLDSQNKEIGSIAINSGLLEFINEENCCILTILN